MKKLLILGVILLVAIFLFLLAGPQEEDVLASELLVTSFSSEDEIKGTVLLQVPFLQSLGEYNDISIAIDTDGDGLFSEEEYLVRNYPVLARADWHSGFYASSALPISAGMKAQLEVSGESYPLSIQTKSFDIEELFDFESVTDPENATKGWGLPLAQAEEDFIDIEQIGVPDLDQRKAECAPTAAANSLIYLVAKNGGEDLIPGDPQDFIENLKRHMNWTPENGVPPDDFVAGKNRWAAAAGVPIRTTKVGDTQGLTTIEQIRDALEKGCAVELRIRFTNPAGDRIIGGHMVTVVGIQQGEGNTYLAINDPGTPNSGTETVEVRSNRITNYAYTAGHTLLSWGFVQCWEGHPTGTLLDTMTDEEIQGIRQAVGDTPMITVIEYQGKYLPTSQLKVEDEEGCGDRHWHAARNGYVTATDGTKVPDPGPQCGYGKVKDRPSMNIPAPDHSGAGINQ